MDDFFARYKSVFTPNPSASPSTNFSLLCTAIPSWSRTPKPASYRRAYTRYCALLAAENIASADPVRLFFPKFDGFDYDHERVGSGGPSGEFERLAAFRKWKVGGKKYRQAKKDFELASEHSDEMKKLACADLNHSAPTAESQQDHDKPASVDIVESQETEGKDNEKDVRSRDSSSQSSQVPEENIPAFLTLHINPSAGSGPLDEFFRSFHDFQYSVSTPSEKEFERLATEKGWNRKKKPFKKARGAFMNASMNELHWQLDRDDIIMPTLNEEEEDSDDEDEDSESGTDEDVTLHEMEKGPKPWRKLCEVLDLRMEGGRRRPKSEEDCQEVLSKVYINIFDFIYALRIGVGTLRRLPGLKDLSDYSYENGKVFPRQRASASPVLKFLLQPLSAVQGPGKKGRRQRRVRRAPNTTGVQLDTGGVEQKPAAMKPEPQIEEGGSA